MCEKHGCTSIIFLIIPVMPFSGPYNLAPWAAAPQTGPDGDNGN